MRFLLVLGRKTFKYSQITRIVNLNYFTHCFCSRLNVPRLLHNPQRISDSFYSNNVYFSSYVSNFDTDGTGARTYLQDIRDNPRLTGEQRLALLDELWGKLENSLALQEEHFILKLECLMKSRAKVVPKTFMKAVTDAGLDKSERLLRVLLMAVAEHGDPGYVSSVITSMKSRNYIVDETVFSGLITAYGVTRDSANVRFVLNSMQECGIKPGPMTYTSLMRAAGIAGDYAALHTARTQAEENGVTFSSENILSVLETLARYSRHHLISSIKSLAVCCSPDQLNNLATSLVYSGFAPGAYSVLKLTNSDNLTPRCKDFVQDMLHVNTPLNQLIDVADAMKEDATYERAYYDIMFKKMQDSKIEDAVTIITSCLESGQSVRAHFFYPLMLSAHRQSGEKGIWDILGLMKTLKIVPDSETFTDFVLPHLTLDEHDAVLKRLKDASGVTISALIVPFLSHLLRSGNLLQVVNLYRLYEKSIPRNEMSTLMTYLEIGYTMTRDYKTVAQLIQIFKIQNVGNWLMMLFSQRKWLPLAEYILLFKELAKLGCWITPQEEKWLLQIFLRNNSLSEEIKSALSGLVNEEGEPTVPVFIPHPNEMNANELKNHVIELESKGGNTRGALRRLLQQCCRSRDVQGAQTAYKKLVKMGENLTPGMMSSLFHAFVQAGQLNDASETYKFIVEGYPEFHLDSFKILDFATLLVKSGKYQDAIDLINQNPQQRRRVDSIERNCWELMSATADMGHSFVNVQQMVNVLLVNNYCKPSNVVLGPLIKKMIKNGDIDAAVTEFCACVRTHKTTPVQLDVMIAVVSNMDEALISTTRSAIASVHGVDNARAVYVTASALIGNRERIIAELTEADMKLNNKKLRSQIERMCDLGQVEALQLLFSVFFDQQDGNLHYLIDRLLYTYQKTGDADGALQFWNDVQRKGLQLSQTQESSLAALVASTGKN